MVIFSATRLREHRRAAGLRTEHLAIATGRTAETVNDWERGRVVPPTQLLGRIAEVVGVSLADLFEEAGTDAA